MILEIKFDQSYLGGSNPPSPPITLQAVTLLPDEASGNLLTGLGGDLTPTRKITDDAIAKLYVAKFTKLYVT